MSKPDFQRITENWSKYLRTWEAYTSQNSNETGIRPFVVLKLKIEDDPPTGHLEFGISPRVSCIITRLRFSSAKSKQFWQLDNITPTRLISCTRNLGISPALQRSKQSGDVCLCISVPVSSMYWKWRKVWPWSSVTKESGRSQTVKLVRFMCPRQGRHPLHSPMVRKHVEDWYASLRCL